MTALEMLQPHKAKKFVAIKEYDFDVKDFRASYSTEERLAKLMLVLVDGPESLTIREAAKRLSLPHSHAKHLLKTQRKIHDKASCFSASEDSSLGRSFPHFSGDFND